MKVDERNRCRGCVPPELRSRLPGRRSPLLAAAFSTLPGLGQLYTGAVGRGLLFLAAMPILAAHRAAVPDPIPLFLWVFNLFDAHLLARRRNIRIGAEPPDPALDRQGLFFTWFGLLVAGFALVRRAALPDLDPSLLWPAALLLFCAFQVLPRRSSDVRTA